MRAGRSIATGKHARARALVSPFGNTGNQGTKEDIEMKEQVWKGNRGFTLIELVIALAVLAIMLALAAPSMRNIAARADIKEATDVVVQALRSAKHSARLSNCSVTVTLTTNGSANNISFLFPDGSNTAENGLSLLPIELPEKISVSAATTTFTYNPMGMINATGTITLASTLNNQQASTIVINNTMGYVTASYASMGG